MALAKDEKIIEIVEYYIVYGLEQTCHSYNIQEETVQRYLRHYKNSLGINIDKNKILLKLAEKYNITELQSILKGSIIKPQKNTSIINFDGEEITFAHITDSHIGSKYFSDNYLLSFLEECEKQNVDFICHTGDVTEGMSNRPGHIYSLNQLGFDNQKQKVVDLFSQSNIPVHVIDGNHDRWFIKSSGAIIVKDIANELKNWTYLGHDTGYININDIKIQLWHGEDGSSYAISYRIQKLIESISGGEKPHILLCGHTHKMGYFFIRNIHAISGGALSWQSDWMRSKRLEHHAGFWIIKAVIAEGQVKSLEPRWYPIYKR
jgi:predicted phosphodiesterase